MQLLLLNRDPQIASQSWAEGSTENVVDSSIGLSSSDPMEGFSGTVLCLCSHKIDPACRLLLEFWVIEILCKEACDWSFSSNRWSLIERYLQTSTLIDCTMSRSPKTSRPTRYSTRIAGLSRIRRELRCWNNCPPSKGHHGIHNCYTYYKHIL